MMQIKVLLVVFFASTIAQASVLERGNPSHDINALEIIEHIPEQVNYLEKLLKELNIDVDAIKDHIQASVQTHRIERRSVQSRNETAVAGNDFINGIMDGIYGVINTALKTAVDGMLVSLNSTTNGMLSANLVDLQAFLYSIIDAQFPTTTTTYVSKVIV